MENFLNIGEKCRKLYQNANMICKNGIFFVSLFAEKSVAIEPDNQNHEIVVSTHSVVHDHG